MFGLAKITEKGALARVLFISKEAYGAFCSGKPEVNITVLLDGLSKVLSHAGDENEPVLQLLDTLKLELKKNHKAFFKKAKKYFKRGCYVPEYDYSNALRLIPIMLFGNDKICEKLAINEKGMAKAMCDAMKSCPGYILDEYGALTSEQFYDLVFGFYPKLYDEEFMEPLRYLFV